MNEANRGHRRTHGKRTLLVRYTVKGSDSQRQYRLPQEYGEAPGQLKLSAACAEAGRIRTFARQGADWPAAEEARLETEASARAAVLAHRDAPTLAAELRDYVEKKRRAKDGLALKARTRADYLASIEPPWVAKNGTGHAAGPLHRIAHKSLATLTATDIRMTYEEAARRSLRRAEYAMQILLAVLRWNGVVIPGNPLGRETAGRDRITITTGKGDPAPISPELLGAWWRTAERASSQIASDYYRFQLLTGCRGVEIHGTSCTSTRRSRWGTSTSEQGG